MFAPKIIINMDKNNISSRLRGLFVPQFYLFRVFKSIVYMDRESSIKRGGIALPKLNYLTKAGTVDSICGNTDIMTVPRLSNSVPQARFQQPAGQVLPGRLP